MQMALVVPTKNEELWLPALLALARKTPLINEIVVVDNDCNDELRALCAAHNCHLIKDTTPARSRNAGAAASRSEILIFCDADVRAPLRLYEKTKNIFASDDCDIVHYRLKPMTDRISVNIAYNIMHLYFRLCKAIGRPQGLGNFIAVKRSAFEAISGFDENILVGEDADFFLRASKKHKIKYVGNESVYVSARRFRLENPVVFSVKCIFWAALRFFGLRMSILNYRWEKYAPELASHDQAWERKHKDLLN